MSKLTKEERELWRQRFDALCEFWSVRWELRRLIEDGLEQLTDDQVARIVAILKEKVIR